MHGRLGLYRLTSMSSPCFGCVGFRRRSFGLRLSQPPCQNMDMPRWSNEQTESPVHGMCSVVARSTRYCMNPARRDIQIRLAGRVMSSFIQLPKAADDSANCRKAALRARPHESAISI